MRLGSERRLKRSCALSALGGAQAASVMITASLRKQWAQELEEKFGLPSVVVDTRSDGNPFEEKCRHCLVPVCGAQILCSRRFHGTSSSLMVSIAQCIAVGQSPWEAALAASAPKLLLTAAPLQNSPWSFMGSSPSSTGFRRPSAFKSAFLKGTPDYEALRLRLQPTVHRTLRRAVLPYIQYTARQSMTWRFKLSPAERELYKAVTRFLARDELISLPLQQRALITMVLRKPRVFHHGHHRWPGEAAIQA